MRSHFRFAAAIAVSSLLAACGDTLHFAERDSFKLAIHVGDNPVLPLQVQAGVKRTAIVIAPPKGGIVRNGNRDSRAEGDAVNMFSGFDIRYEKASSPFSGKLGIKTQFASGKAAVTIAARPDLAEAMMGLGGFRPLPKEILPRTQAALEAIYRVTDETKLRNLAKALNLPPDELAQERLALLIRKARTKAEFEPIARAIKQHLGDEV